MKINIKLQLIIFLLVTAGLSSTAFFAFPVLKAAGLEPTAAIAFASSITQMGAVVYLLLNIRTIKHGYKAAYALFALGILLFSSLQVIPSLSIFTTVISNHPQLNNDIIVGSFAAGTLLMYLGMWTFARLLGVRTVWTAPWFAVVFAAITAGVTIFALRQQAMHVALAYPRLEYIIFAAVSWSGSFGLVAAIVALQIRSAIGPIYRTPLTWTSLTLFLVSFSAFHEFITKVYFPTSAYTANSWGLWPYLVTSAMLLVTSMRYMQANHEDVAIPENANYLDIVTSLAAMASKPQDVDKILDTVRTITTSRSAQQLTADDKNALIHVYLQLEDYLVTKEPLHKFTTVSLRDSLPSAFLKELPAEPI